MKSHILILPALLLCTAMPARTPSRTLRLDYIFSGMAGESEISLSGAHSIEGWYGRPGNPDTLLLGGNGRISVSDAGSGRLLYVQSFSTLFQEWQNTEEATRVRRSFENVFLVPMPESPAVVRVDLLDTRGGTVGSLTHTVDPDDILISPVKSEYPHRYLLRSGAPEEKIDVAIVAEGYTAQESGLFYSEAEKAMESILSHEPFKSLRESFNFVAVAAASRDSGVSIPHKGEWRSTALSSSFDTFYSERYLTTLNIFRLHDILACVPYEHIIILANTDNYGGGGIYNSYMMSSTRHRMSAPVIVHEFGHSFAGLADEYFYDDQYEQYYHSDVEPWEPNITTLADFGAKWKDMLERDGIVTKAEQRKAPERGGSPSGEFKVGLYEGAGYMSEGAYRPYPECRMKVNDYPGFCPVCSRAIQRMIQYSTER